MDTATERNRRKLLFHSGFIGLCLVTCVFTFISIVLLCVFHGKINCQGSSI